MRSDSPEPAILPADTLEEQADFAIALHFRALEKKGYLSLADSQAVLRVAARDIRDRFGAPDLVVGIANGALLMTHVMAGEFKRPFEMIYVRRKGSRLKQRLVRIKQALRIPNFLITQGPMAIFWRIFERTLSKRWSTELELQHSGLSFDVLGQTVLLVDDCIVTGASIISSFHQLVQAGAARVIIGTLTLSDDSVVKAGEIGYPDYFMNRMIFYYPWSVNHPQYDEYLAWLEANKLTMWE